MSECDHYAVEVDGELICPKCKQPWGPKIPALVSWLNVNGYPSELGLRELAKFTGTPAQLFEVLEQTFGRMGSVWLDVEVDEFRRCKQVRLATGGWSGNESMITALKRGFFWFAYWEMSRRGGGYTFYVPVEKWDTPMIEWPPAAVEH